MRQQQTPAAADDPGFYVETTDKKQRMKVMIPLQRNWGFLVLYSLALLVWLLMLTLILIYLIGGYSSRIVLTFLLVFWLLIWFAFGRLLWKRWQYQASSREILFIDKEQLIIRRPVSILGSTRAYDMKHVSPFYISEKHRCPAFDYAFSHVYFGQNLGSSNMQELVTFLNEEWFPEESAGLSSGQSEANYAE